MNTNQANFLKWYKQPLEQLYLNPDAGFAILVLSLPLLERYLRERSKIYEASQLSAPFYQECLKAFPIFRSESVVKRFWEACRHGLLHQVTFRQRASDPKLFITGEVAELLYVEKYDKFSLNPKWFSKIVIQLIESDFLTFEGVSSPNHTLPQISFLPNFSDAEFLEKFDSVRLESGVAQPPPSRRP